MEKLGIKRDLSKLSEEDYEILYFINSEFNRIEAENAEKQRKKKR